MKQSIITGIITAVLLAGFLGCNTEMMDNSAGDGAETTDVLSVTRGLDGQSFNELADSIDASPGQRQELREVLTDFRRRYSREDLEGMDPGERRALGQGLFQEVRGILRADQLFGLRRAGRHFLGRRAQAMHSFHPVFFSALDLTEGQEEDIRAIMDSVLEVNRPRQISRMDEAERSAFFQETAERILPILTPEQQEIFTPLFSALQQGREAVEELIDLTDEQVRELTELRDSYRDEYENRFRDMSEEERDLVFQEIKNSVLEILRPEQEPYVMIIMHRLRGR
ncbi:MAG: hypothetical protein ACLFR1_12365 [Spirochaetia bacterium]